MSQRFLDGLRAAIAYGAQPVLPLAAIVSVHLAFSYGYDDGFVLVTGTIFVCSLLTLLMQRIHPAIQEWRAWGPDAGLDLLHMVLSTGGGGELVRAALYGALYAGAASLGELWGESIWPAHWHWTGQLLLALLIADFLPYWVHRLSHSWEPLWRLHALHHSSERLYTFSSGRNHPLHTALTYTAQTAPLVLLGAGAELLALVSVFTAVQGLLQHSNIALKPGALNWVLATADLHRWHHSVDIEESRRNFGNNFVIWDILFGTRYLPEDRPAPEAVGLGRSDFPRNYLGQLASPWTWR